MPVSGVDESNVVDTDQPMASVPATEVTAVEPPNDGLTRGTSTVSTVPATEEELSMMETTAVTRFNNTYIYLYINIFIYPNMFCLSDI